MQAILPNEDVVTCLRQAVFGGPGTLGWSPSREDVEVMWRVLGGALLALTPWTFSLKARSARVKAWLLHCGNCISTVTSYGTLAHYKDCLVLDMRFSSRTEMHILFRLSTYGPNQW